MRNKQLIRSLMAGFLLLANQVDAQMAAIDSLKLIPANPTTNDVLKVVCYTTFPYGGCGINTTHAELQGNSIFLSIDYSMGMLTYICHSVDTIPIDNPGAGTFQLTTTITTNQQDVIEDSHSLTFQIDPYLGINELTAANFQAYPNPFDNELKFKTSFPVAKMELYSMTGQQVYFKETLFENPPVDLSHLEKGIYLVTLTDPNGNSLTQRVIKH